MYCKYCSEQVYGDTHSCPKKGLLNVDEDDSFLVSAIIGGANRFCFIGRIVRWRYCRGSIG